MIYLFVDLEPFKVEVRVGEGGRVVVDVVYKQSISKMSADSEQQSTYRHMWKGSQMSRRQNQPSLHLRSNFSGSGMINISRQGSSQNVTTTINFIST